MGKYAQPELRGDGGLGRNDTGSPYVARKPESLGWTDIAVGAQPGTVFDPFAGIGTTGIVALRLGRSFLGCELYPDHADKADKALGRAARRLSGDLRPAGAADDDAATDVNWDEPATLTDAVAGGCL